MDSLNMRWNIIPLTSVTESLSSSPFHVYSVPSQKVYLTSFSDNFYTCAVIFKALLTLRDGKLNFPPMDLCFIYRTWKCINSQCIFVSIRKRKVNGSGLTWKLQPRYFNLVLHFCLLGSCEPNARDLRRLGVRGRHTTLYIIFSNCFFYHLLAVHIVITSLNSLS